MVGLHVETLGSGPRVVLLHADVATGATGWHRQRSLADHFQLVIPDRPGYGRSMPTSRVDFETEVDHVRPLLDGGAHLVGHSYGGVVALLIAAAHPEVVHSLTVIEPPAFAVSNDHAVRQMLDDLKTVWVEEPADPEAFFARFAALMGERVWPRSPMPEAMEVGVRQLMAERRPWEAQLDLAAIRSAQIPAMVVSGGHAAALEVVCDIIAEGTAARRMVIKGAKHAVPRVGAPFNEALQQFISHHDPVRAEPPSREGQPSTA